MDKIEGWRIVPKELTQEMKSAFMNRIDLVLKVCVPEYDLMDAIEMAWDAALAVAPTPPAQETEPVASLTISHFRGHLENRELDYYGDLPDGTHKLYTHPANDELLQAAEKTDAPLEALLYITDDGITHDELTKSIAAIRENLRAALEKK